MSKKKRQAPSIQSSLSKGERALATLIGYLIGSDLTWVGRVLLKVVRWKWHDRAIRPEGGAEPPAPLPEGPFETTRKEHIGDLLLWVPRRVDSYLIDDLTGGYGYSHSTVDTGEIDAKTGKPVMVEITVGETVMRKFQDEYGARPFVRLPLWKIGVNVQAFVACVKSKLGEQYDAWDALTLGEIENPAKEICSKVAADCLPEKEVRQIALARRVGLLRKASVSVHSKLNALKTNAFVSPNGFAEFYGAPKGMKLSGPDIIVQPKRVEVSVKSVAAVATRRHGWKVAAGLLALAVTAILLRRRWIG